MSAVRRRVQFGARTHFVLNESCPRAREAGVSVWDSSSFESVPDCRAKIESKSKSRWGQREQQRESQSWCDREAEGGLEGLSEGLNLNVNWEGEGQSW